MRKFFIFVFCFLIFNNAQAASEEITVKIYSEAGDGHVTTAPYPASWETQYYSTQGRNVEDNLDYLRIKAGALNTDAGYTGIVRTFLSFDTSVIPSEAEIKEVKFKSTVTSIRNDYDDTYSYINIFPSFQVNPSELTNSDISLCGSPYEDPEKLSDDKYISDLMVDEEVEFSIDDYTWLDKDGFSKLCFREGHDIENVEASSTVYTGTWKESWVYFASSEAPGTSTDPYLEITYTIPVEDPEREGLYTQIESPYPSVAETSAWAVGDYAGGKNYSCGSTIGECGCAITSLVMVGRDAGIVTDVLGDDVNPSNMNAYLESVGGYNEYGSVFWLAAQAYLSEITTDTKLASKLKWEGSYYSNVTDVLDDRLENEDHAVLGFSSVSGGHFVRIASLFEDTYEVFDPYWYDTEFADETESSDTVQNYNNNFESVRVYDILSEAQVVDSGVEAYLVGTGELLFEKVSGEKVGYEGGSVVIDLDRSSYGDEGIISLVGNSNGHQKHLLVSDAGDDFTLEVLGTETGEFLLSLFTISESGEIETFEFEGSTVSGQVTKFTINLETGEVSEEIIPPEDDEEEIDLVSVIQAAVEGERRSTQKLLIAQAKGVIRSIERNRTFVALFKLRVLEFSLQRRGIDDAAVNDAIEKIREDLKS